MTSKKTPAVRSGKAKTKKPTEGVSLAANAQKTASQFDPSVFDKERYGAAFSSIYKSKRRQITLRLHEDVILWFKAKGPGYQSYMAAVLRIEMLHAMRAEQKKPR